MDTKEEKQKNEEKNKQGGEPQEGENVESTNDEKNKQQKKEAGTALKAEIDEAMEWIIKYRASYASMCGLASEEEIRAGVKALQEELAGSDAAYSAALQEEIRAAYSAGSDAAC